MSDNAGSSSCEGTSAVDQRAALETLASTTAAVATSDWTPEEESGLKQALLLYTAEKYPTSLERCILIAAQLPTRSAREVALRISLLTAQQQPPVVVQGSRPTAAELKRRSSTPAQAAPTAAKAAGASRHSSRNKQQQQQAAASRQAPPPPPVPLLSLQALASLAPPAPSLELQEIPPPGPVRLLPSLSASCFFQSPSTSNTTSGEEASCLINLNATTAADQGTSGSAETSFGDPTPSMAATHPCTGPPAVAPPMTSEQSLVNAVQALMEQNYAILNTFKANMQQCKVGENTELLVRFRDNVVACLNHMNSEQLAGGTIANMPPLPVQPNLELANKFLPAKVGMPMGPMGPMPPMGMPPFPFNPAMGPMPGMPLMFPPMGGPPGMMPSMMPPGMPGMPHMPPFPMPGMPGMPVPPGMPSAAPPSAMGMGMPPMMGPGGMMIPPPGMAQPTAAQQSLPTNTAVVKQEPS